METVAGRCRNRAPLSDELGELPGQESLGAVATGSLGMGVNLNGQTRSSGRDSG